MDQPSIDGINTWFVSKAAREAGLKVAISGLGGDELLAGYPSFVDVPRWRRRFGPLAAVPGLGRLARQFMRAFPLRVAAAQPKALGLLEYADSWAGAYLLRRGLFLPHELSEVMERDFAREGLRRLKPLRRLAACLVPDPGSDTARVCALESSHYLRNQLLRDADWAGMAHGIEIRVPLVDVSAAQVSRPGDHEAGTWRGQSCACAGAFHAAPRSSRESGEDRVQRADGGMDGRGVPAREAIGGCA